MVSEIYTQKEKVFNSIFFNWTLWNLSMIIEKVFFHRVILFKVVKIINSTFVC